MSSLEFWYEFASPYSYPAAMRIEPRAQALGVRVRWRPFLLGPIFAAQGWTTSPFVMNPAKGRYMWRDMERLCAAEGLAFQRPDPFPQSSLLAARLAIALDETARPAFTRAVFEAEFVHGRTIGEPEAMASVLDEFGVDPAPLMAQAQSPDIKAALKAQGAVAHARGIFGAPTFLTEDGEMFWGFDRMDAALAWAGAHEAG